ncbi:MAG: hypothetical protein NTX56_04075 [Proteobacteria bacterium]|nr:hypothetical protein [Pseudomonadota bacterium]
MDELAKRFADLAEKYGPNVVDAARGAVRIEAYSSIQGYIVGLLVAIACALVGRWCWQKNARDDLDIPFGRAGAVVLFLAAGIAVAVVLSGLTDPWLWTALNQPDLWLAKRIFKL